LTYTRSTASRVPTFGVVSRIVSAGNRPSPKCGPGSVGWLYSEGFESQYGRQPGTLQSLAIERKKRTRAALAQLG
jgi:hypothetical protein